MSSGGARLRGHILGWARGDLRSIGVMTASSCPACGVSVPADATECPDCGHVLQNTISITALVILALVLVGVIVTVWLVASWDGPTPLT